MTRHSPNFYLKCRCLGLVIIYVLYILCDSSLVFGQSEDIKFEDELNGIPIGNDFDEFDSTRPITIPEEADVFVLNKDNFYDVVGAHKFILVEFFAPWCEHCKDLEPEYAKAASALKKDNIRIGKVDATAEVELAQDYEISGYPTLKLFKDGQVLENYDGAMTSTGIIEFMKMQLDPHYKPPPSMVNILVTSNFTSFVDSTDLSLIEFYAPWCGHCKALAPEFEGAALDLRSDKIPLAKVDATEETDLAKKYGVSGYPRLFIFRRGKSYDYKGPRQHAGIVSYMREQANSPSSLMKELAYTKNRLSRTEPSVFAYFDWENNQYEEFMYAANVLREDYSFLHTFDNEIARHYGFKENSVNIIFPEIYSSKYEEKIKHFDKFSGNYEDLTKWISRNIIPLVGLRSRTNMAVRYSNRPLLVVYYDVNFSHQFIKATQIIRNKILPVAHAHRDITFSISIEDDFAEELKSLGLDDSGEDVNVAIFGIKDVKYPMEPDEDFDTEGLKKFVRKFLNGSLKPYMKSQPIPKKQDGPVRTIVAKSFEMEVISTNQDILIEFYAPWCGHCKKLEPIYKKVAKHFAKENPGLTVAKMDATANDVHPLFSVSGFPTIYLLKASSKDTPILFEGHDRNFEEIKDFVIEHITKEEPRASEHLTKEEEPRASEHLTKEEPKASEHLMKEEPRASEDLMKEEPRASEHLTKEEPRASEHLTKEEPKVSEHLTKEEPIKDEL